MLLQQRDADFFGRSGIDRGFIDHGRALLHVFTHRGGRADQGREIGDVSVIDRSGHGDDDEVGAADRGRVGTDREPRCRLQILAADFAGRVAIILVMSDLGVREVEPYGFKFFPEFHGKRQAHIAQADDGNDAHDDSPVSSV